MYVLLLSAINFPNDDACNSKISALYAHHFPLLGGWGYYYNCELCSSVVMKVAAFSGCLFTRILLMICLFLGSRLLH